MKLNVLRAAKARAEAGDWVGDIPGCGDLRLHVRGIGNKDHLRIVREALPPPDAPELTEEQRLAVTANVICGALLIGWENLTGDDDEPVPYSPKVADRIVRSPDFEAFRGAVLWAAAQVAKARPDDSVRDVVEGVAAPEPAQAASPPEFFESGTIWSNDPAAPFVDFRSSDQWP